MTREQLLAEIEDCLRTMPPREKLGDYDDNMLAWSGRVSAILRAWSVGGGARADLIFKNLRSEMAREHYSAVGDLIVLLHQVRHELRMETVGPLSVAVEAGGVYDYFDEVRKVVEAATADVFFVDAYLEAEFVSRYLPHVTKGVTVRLLTRERLNQLIPAVEAFAVQHGSAIYVRSAKFHDRFVFVDGKACYQSGASFKDGAKKAPTTLTQIADAFPAVRDTYEKLWDSGQVYR